MEEIFGVLFENFTSPPEAALSPGEKTDSPPVQILDARTGKGERAIGNQPLMIRVTAVFKKYTTLEDTTFAFFKHDRRNYYVHFHAETHNRCETRLKPNLWDNGAYFKSELLKDGALRIIPHFLPQVTREEASRKRPALSSPIETPMLTSTPTPQKRRQEQADPAPSSPVASSMTISTSTPRKTLQQHLDPVSPTPQYHTAPIDLTMDSGDDDLGKQEAFEQAQARRSQRKPAVDCGSKIWGDVYGTDKFNPAKNRDASSRCYTLRLVDRFRQPQSTLHRGPP